MRILILHQNKFDRMRYEHAINHDTHDVTYAGAAEYVENIPPHIRCTTFTWDPVDPVGPQLRTWVAGQKPFDRLIARHEDLIMAAAELRSEFGIPGMRPEVARNFRDKVAMKHTLLAAGIRVPRFVELDQPTEADVPWTGKTILKPRDARGSQGVVLFNTVSEALKHIATRKIPRGRYELEEYVEGPIWHVDGFLFDGEAVLCVPSRYVGTALRFEGGEPVGSVQFDHAQLAEWSVACVRELGGRTLTFHLEAIMTPEGPIFMEVAARCGGGYIVTAIERRTGIHLHSLDMASEVDGALATRFTEPRGDEAKYGFFLFPGHVHGGSRITVKVPPERLEDPVLVSHQLAEPETPTTRTHSYRPEHLPFSGLVRGQDPASLEAWIRALFAETNVTRTSTR